MKNSLIPKKKLCLWERVKNFWKIKILRKFDNNDNDNNNEKINTSEIKDISVDEVSPLDEQKVDIKHSTNTEYKLEQFIQEIEDNPDLLNYLSDDRLDKLIEYYERIIMEKQNKIEKLKISLDDEE